MNGFVCLLMFVFCVCLTAVALSGLFANILEHEQRQVCREGRATERQGEREAGRLCKMRQMGPPQRQNK